MIGGVFVLVVVIAVLQVAVAKDNGLARTPPMAWNSWNHFACDISESLIKETAHALVDLGLVELGYNHVNLDDCWQEMERDTYGRVIPSAARFPSGMKALVDEVHGLGLKFGIYSSGGFKTCQAYPASLGLEDVDAATYRDWGVDFLKYDNCYTDHGAPQSRYARMSEALDQVAAEGSSDRKILYSMCEWGRENPATWAPKIANTWRVTNDIFDGFRSITTRAAIDAPLWRYAQPGAWNDPDMLEVGNGGCTTSEYRYHFSLWSMLKAPLIIGNDIRNMTKEDAAYQILSNKEVIAVNQDALGRQARRVWSNTMELGRGNRLIATKCATGNVGAYEDAPIDQHWQLQADGTIKSLSAGTCLVEMLPTATSNLSNVESEVRSLGLFGVYAGDCATATTWDAEAYQGGSYVSKVTGRCLEVSKFELEPLVQGKRIQTGQCHSVSKKVYLTAREHQSWTQANGQLRNLYQRQCLTVDRDAPAGSLEVWSTSLADGSIAALLVNKSPLPATISVSWTILGITADQQMQVRDLWEHRTFLKPASNSLGAVVPSHDVVMYKLTPVA